eukprot:GHVQ01043531.1.p1 GENE.GHVQ01043531.1~~GHVQ01043531.1.p1  ORF type:complete len:241 (+),score=21.17 GHVQ01043531.1:671-1393(+)
MRSSTVCYRFTVTWKLAEEELAHDKVIVLVFKITNSAQADNDVCLSSAPLDPDSKPTLAQEGYPYYISIYWPPGYPKTNIPLFFFDPTYNSSKRSIVADNDKLRSVISEFLDKEAEKLLIDDAGAITFSLVQLLKEDAYNALGICEMYNSTTKSLFDEVGKTKAKDQTAGVDNTSGECSESVKKSDGDRSAMFQDLQHLSKSQKRNRWNKLSAATGERPRGWDWIDIISHLSKTGVTSND